MCQSVIYDRFAWTCTELIYSTAHCCVFVIRLVVLIEAAFAIINLMNETDVVHEAMSNAGYIENISGTISR
jgi:hypothetical protein